MSGPAAAEALLVVNDLRQAYRDRTVLDGVSFDVREGEVFGLLGPNGSGKSTALAILSGLLARRGGTITWRGRALSGADRAFRAELGVVFQRPAVDAKLSARRNLLLAGRLAGQPPAVTRARADKLLEEAGLADRAEEPVDQFSGGMKRRLDIARALLADPKILLLDEPTAGLDEAAFRGTWERLLAARRERGLTILVATHRPDEAACCDRLAVIDQGRIARIATPTELQALVSRDVIVLEGPEPEALREALRERLGLTPMNTDGRILVECERGHELIPRIVEALAGIRLDSVSLRRPTLADAFLKITGRGLDRDVTP